MTLPSLEQLERDIVSELAAARLAELRTRAEERERLERARESAAAAEIDAAAFAALRALARLAERRREVLQSLAPGLHELSELSARISADFNAALQPAVDLAHRRGMVVVDGYVDSLLDRAGANPPQVIDLPADLPGARLAATIGRALVGGCIGPGWIRSGSMTTTFDID